MNREFRPINQALGKQPRFGPFPAGQVIPFTLIIFVSVLFKEALGLSWLYFVLLAAWLMGTVWILTGRAHWRFFSKFKRSPHWVRVSLRYQSPLVWLEKSDKYR